MSIPNYKDIVELLKKGLTIEAQEKIMELREAAMELQEQNLALRERVVALESELKQSKNLKFDGGLYYMHGDPDPFCPLCYERDKKLIHLVKNGQQEGYWPSCLVCNESFEPRNRNG